MKTNTFMKLSTGIALSFVASTMLHATNGDTLISVGTKTRGMGGAGIGMSHGAESALTNPSMITNFNGTEISFGGTIFMPDITTTLNSSGFIPPQKSHTSDADINMIPEVSLAHKINDKWYIGIGMWGTAGMGVDYSKATNAPFTTGQYGNFNMVTNLQLMQFAIPVAYKVDGLSIAFSPILQYGNLDMNFRMPSQTNPGQMETIGAGLAQDFGFGWSVGAAYDLHNGFIIGAVYKSSIEMDYDGQIVNAASKFNLEGIGDTLEQPSEYGIGFSYAMGQHTFAFDYRNIQWSDAKGYGFVEWEDQDVFAFGYQYSQDNWAFRMGYNYASSTVTEQAGSPMMSRQWMADSAINFFNLLGFPATEESHLTLGGTYVFNNQFSLDLAYVHGFSNKETFQTPAYAGNPALQQGMGISSITTDHSEDSVSFQLTHKF